MLFKKTKKNFYIAIFLQFVKNNTNSLKGQSHDIFFVLGFSSKQILLVPLDMSYWLSYGHFKMTPRCPMYRGVETPRVLCTGESRLPDVLCTGESQNLIR